MVTPSTIDASDIRELAETSRLDRTLQVLAVIVGILVIAVPLASSRYPAMTDLPFHAAETSTLRHYFDPSYHFREQFTLRLFTVPYLLEFALGALFMLVFPPVIAMKLAVGTLLALLPIGLSVLLRGMRKNPMLGVLGLVCAWGPLTHWGFLNFLGAIGLYAMALGLAMLVVERPTVLRRLALAVTLLLVFGTHLFRFPFALAGTIGVAVFVARPLRAARAIILPVLPAIATFAAWLAVRPASLGDPRPTLQFTLARLSEFPTWLSGSFEDPGEVASQRLALALIGCVIAFGVASRAYADSEDPGSMRPNGSVSLVFRLWLVLARIVRMTGLFDDSESGFRRRARLAAWLGMLGSLVLFLCLPMAIGNWWYVYPREATAVALLSLALLPDLPRSPVPRIFTMVAALLAPVPIMANVAKNYAVFHRATEDFHSIIQRLPPAPRLAYLVFDHEGSTRTISPFTHLPAYVQAERGGWLNFHFVKFGASPMDYRPREGNEDVVPPPTPPGWEGTPEKFDVFEHGAFFDWFLIRKFESPAAIFAPDPTVEPVCHEGTWWLYRRKGPRKPLPLQVSQVAHREVRSP